MMNLPAMSPEALVYGLVWSHSVQSMFALAIGFAVAGAIAHGYQALMLQPASFGLLEQSDRSRALTAVPLLVFAGPFLLVRFAVLSNGGQSKTRRGRFGFTMIATVIAGLWSLMSGTIVMSALGLLGLVSVV